MQITIPHPLARDAPRRTQCVLQKETLWFLSFTTREPFESANNAASRKASGRQSAFPCCLCRHPHPSPIRVTPSPSWGRLGLREQGGSVSFPRRFAFLRKAPSGRELSAKLTEGARGIRVFILLYQKSKNHSCARSFHHFVVPLPLGGRLPKKRVQGAR